MFFGGFDEYDDVLSFDDEIKKDHHLTLAAFYVLYLMMIIVTSLGMLNILLAAIITDYKENMKEVTACLKWKKQFLAAGFAIF